MHQLLVPYVDIDCARITYITSDTAVVILQTNTIDDCAEIYYVLLRSKQKIVIIGLLMQITLLSAIGRTLNTIQPCSGCFRMVIAGAPPCQGQVRVPASFDQARTQQSYFQYTSDLMKLLGVQGRLEGVCNCLFHDTAIDSQTGGRFFARKLHYSLICMDSSQLVLFS